MSLYTVNDVLLYDGVKNLSKILPADLQLSPSSPLCCQKKRLSLYLCIYFDFFIYLSIFLCGMMTCFRFRHGAIWSGAAARRTQTVNKLLKLELNSRNGAFKLNPNTSDGEITLRCFIPLWFNEHMNRILGVRVHYYISFRHKNGILVSLLLLPWKPRVYFSGI